MIIFYSISQIIYSLSFNFPFVYYLCVEITLFWTRFYRRSSLHFPCRISWMRAYWNMMIKQRTASRKESLRERKRRKKNGKDGISPELASSCQNVLFQFYIFNPCSIPVRREHSSQLHMFIKFRIAWTLSSGNWFQLPAAYFLRSTSFCWQLACWQLVGCFDRISKDWQHGQQNNDERIKLNKHCNSNHARHKLFLSDILPSFWFATSLLCSISINWSIGTGQTRFKEQFAFSKHHYH